MKWLVSLWQQLSDSVALQMPSKMTACPRHGGHSHRDGVLPSQLHIPTSPKGSECKFKGEFKGSSLLSPGHSVHV